MGRAATSDRPVTSSRRIQFKLVESESMSRLQSNYLSVSVMEEGSSKFLTSAGFDVCNAKLQATALTTIRKAVGLPSDVAFHRSMDHDFAQDLDTISERVLLVTNKLLNLVATVDEGKRRRLASQDDVVDNFHSLVADSMDQLLEKTVSFQRRSFSVYI